MCFCGVDMETQIQVRRDSAISARIPYNLKKLMQKYVALDTHINESEFIRDAIREKIRREAPDLCRELFEKQIAEVKPNV
jgi:Arc/MetJ-type ribon-helix-helix transcriptional regulator